MNPKIRSPKYVIELAGITTIRFKNDDVISNIGYVLSEIKEYLI
jgi:very-short-patch-repair endonuclease